MKILIKNQQRHRPLNNTKITKAARRILSLLKHPKSMRTELSILFVGDRKMLKLNKIYRGINKSTDVLSFEANIHIKQNEVDSVLGDIVINIPRAELQAKDSGTCFYDEISRLLIHGTLHLLGYNHKASSYRARIMRKKEQEIFNAIKKMDSKHRSCY